MKVFFVTFLFPFFLHANNCNLLFKITEPVWVTKQREVIYSVFPHQVNIEINSDTIIRDGIKLTSESIKNLTRGTHSFVVAENSEGRHELWIGHKHSDLLFKKVFAAGDIMVEFYKNTHRLKKIKINNRSGTYMMSLSSIRFMVEALWANEIYCENLEITNVFDIPLLIFNKDKYKRESILLTVDVIPDGI